MSGSGRTALTFAAAGAAAAALHVVTETPAEARDWRQTLPLAALLGAALGGLARPRSALAGVLWTALGLAAFLVVFAVGHGAIETARGDAAPLDAAITAAKRVGAALFGPTGAAALALGAAAGWLNGRGAPSPR